MAKSNQTWPIESRARTGGGRAIGERAGDKKAYCKEALVSLAGTFFVFILSGTTKRSI